MMLVGDIGATKTLLELGELSAGRWHPLASREYATAAFPTFEHALETFLREVGVVATAIGQACFGVAGPVTDGRVAMTNAPWIVDAQSVREAFAIPAVHVVNDFAAAAAGVPLLHADDLTVLQKGEPLARAPCLVIGAGSGLGVAYLAWHDDRYEVIAGEAGHAGFAPATAEQLELARYLHEQAVPVTVEHVVSGPGLVRIRDFIVRSDRASANSLYSSPAAIAQAALDGRDAACVRALDLFIACYGDAARNHALAVMARGGVYITGGIAPKILPRLKQGGFMTAFNAQGAHEAHLRKMPVAVVTNMRLALLGCAALAAR